MPKNKDTSIISATEDKIGLLKSFKNVDLKNLVNLKNITTSKKVMSILTDSSLLVNQEFANTSIIFHQKTGVLTNLSMKMTLNLKTSRYFTPKVDRDKKLKRTLSIHKNFKLKDQITQLMQMIA